MPGRHYPNLIQRDLWGVCEDPGRGSAAIIKVAAAGKGASRYLQSVFYSNYECIYEPYLHLGDFFSDCLK